VVLPRDLGRFLAWVEEVGFSGGDRIRRKVVDGVKVELFIAHHEKELGALVFHTTGDWQWNVAMRAIAIRKGLRLNQYGLWKGAKAVLQSPDEREFFKALGVRYHDPEERSFASRG
jgi:DNA polymerase (family 10)